MSLRLLTSREAVEPFVELVSKAADSERNAFGFLPDAAYREFAYQSRMHVAVDSITQALAGYVLFGGAMPQGRIFQTYVAPADRGRGVGEALIKTVIETLERQTFLSLRADVAADLAAANAFYDKQGFDTLRTRLGVKGRLINIRVRELSTPSLLDLAISATTAACMLPITAPDNIKAPLYIIDLNVLFDTAKRRARSPDTGRVFGTGFEQHITLAVTTELVRELERHSPVGKPDPILEFARALPSLPASPSAVKLAKSDVLAAIVFPDQTRDGVLSTQDASDLLHLATAIEECATGFITSENAILKAGLTLKERYGLEILSPEAFGQGFAVNTPTGGDIHITIGSSKITTAEVDDDNWSAAERFLAFVHVDGVRKKEALSAGTTSLPRRRYIASIDGLTVAFASWNAPRVGDGWRELHIYVSEDSPIAATAAEYLIQKSTRDLGPARPAHFRVLPHSGQSTVRRVAFAMGFRASEAGIPRSPVLEKASLGQLVLPQGWAEFVSAVETRVGIQLPKRPPEFSNLGQGIHIETKQGEIQISVADLESLLTPAILALDGRPGVVLPIRAAYAEELFRGSAQPSFVTTNQAILLKDRGYISSSSTYGIIPDGGLAIFYESSSGNGRKAAIAVARILRRYLISKPAASTFSSARGVISSQQIKKMGRSNQVTVTEFDNVMLFKIPVPLSQLRVLGCADGANFVTARAVPSDVLQNVLRSGQPHV